MPDPLAADVERIGILLVGVDELNVPALQFLITHLNCLQKSFQYEFLPINEDDAFVRQIVDARQIDREKLRAQVADFLVRHRAFLVSYTNALKEEPPKHFVVVTLGRFGDNFVAMRQGDLGVIALGDWKRSLAPPSALEFIVTLVVRESLAFVSPSLRGSIHLGTKGCLCDFAMYLGEMRFKTLQGFLCSHCQTALRTDGRGELVKDILAMLNKQWLGKPADPGSPAWIVANLGYDLFVTKGLQPTRWEKILATIQDEGVKEVLKIVGGIILAGLLLWLGLKR